MEKYKSDFIENLLFYRTQKNMSQLELSGICDCAKSTISSIESKKNFPSFELILKIAYALEIHPADLFLRDASKSKEEIRTILKEKITTDINQIIDNNLI
ncbi:MAG: helix-turn-helix domain-containing protein [Treponema sp.]|nr:helix-turn-helix domain-containing protein [Treponema sp.]